MYTLQHRPLPMANGGNGLGFLPFMGGAVDSTLLLLGVGLAALIWFGPSAAKRRALGMEKKRYKARRKRIKRDYGFLGLKGARKRYRQVRGKDEFDPSIWA